MAMKVVSEYTLTIRSLSFMPSFQWLKRYPMNGVALIVTVVSP